jgi:hypothetical protein
MPAAGSDNLLLTLHIEGWRSNVNRKQVEPQDPARYDLATDFCSSFNFQHDSLESV